MDWNSNTAIAAGALIVSIVLILIRTFDKNLSIREHDEYKRGIRDKLDEQRKHVEDRLVIREFEAWVLTFRHDVDRIEGLIQELDKAKPTTGELQAAAKALEDRMVAVEARFRDYRLLNNDHDARRDH